MVITFVVECLDFFRSQVDENHIAPLPKDRWSIFRQDGFRKLYPMFAIKKMQFYPVPSILNAWFKRLAKHMIRHISKQMTHLSGFL